MLDIGLNQKELDDNFVFAWPMERMFLAVFDCFFDFIELFRSYFHACFG